MFNRLTPVVLNLVILNAIVFVAVNLLHPDWVNYLALWKSDLIIPRYYPPDDIMQFRPYQIVSHFFTHGSMMHILFNMFALASLGPLIESVLGSKRFLEFYLFTGLVSGLIVAFLDPSAAPVVGASGAISGIVVAFAYYFPKQKLYLMFIPIGIEAKKLVIGFAILSVVLILIGLKDGGSVGGISHFGHVAGMAAAVLYGFVNKLLKRYNGPNNNGNNPWR